MGGLTNQRTNGGGILLPSGLGFERNSGSSAIQVRETFRGICTILNALPSGYRHQPEGFLLLCLRGDVDKRVLA